MKRKLRHVALARHPRFPQLDGLRAGAAIAVFATHVALVAGFTSVHALGPLTARLNVGVALFFLLSAFLLYRPWVAARLDARPKPELGRYALRRLVRILPAYWMLLLVLGLALPDQAPGALGSDWWVYFGLTQVYSMQTILGGLGVAWSLSTEVAFYLALPALAYATSRLLCGRPRRQQVRWELWGLGISVVAAFGVRELADRNHWLATFNNTLPGKWPWFAAGLAFAVMSAAWSGCPAQARPWALRTSSEHPWLWWATAGAVLLLGAYGGVLPRDVFSMTHHELQLETLLFGVFAVSVMAPLVFSEQSTAHGPSRVLGARPVTWLGTISYGIFLWHYPVISWIQTWLQFDPLVITAAVSLAITLALATASWYLLERPLMGLTARRQNRPDCDAAPGTPSLEPAP